jgi:hypothetical protein
MPMFDVTKIPPLVKGAIDRHIQEGRPCGSCTTAILENNLRLAFAYADEYTVQAMFHIVAYLYNEAPVPCWGSPEKVQTWKQAGGLQGLSGKGEGTVPG